MSASPGGMLLVMDSNGSALERLSRDECLRLMATVPIGRIVYTRQALPAVELVNFALLDGDIVIRTHAAGKLAAATRGAVVAFETDHVDLDRQAGWSVTVVGQARAVTDGPEIHRLEGIALNPWLAEKRDHFIRIAPTMVNGGNFATPGQAPAVWNPRLCRDGRRRNPPLQSGSRARGTGFGRV